LKRERIEDLPERDKHCTLRSGPARIGQQVSERYEYPAQMNVIEDACFTYACACTVKTATKPAQSIEKSAAGASLLAQIHRGQVRGSPAVAPASEDVCAGVVGSNLVRMDGAMRATAGTVIPATQAVRAGL
jgi:hypothetical protein